MRLGQRYRKEVRPEDIMGKEWSSNRFVATETREDGKIVWIAQCMICGGIKKSTNLQGLKYERTCKLCIQKEKDRVKQEDSEYMKQKRLEHF